MSKNSSNLNQSNFTQDLIPAPNTVVHLGNENSPFTGLYLANSGGTSISELDFYQEYSTTVSFVCLQGTPVDVVINITRIGNKCSLNIPAFNITSGTGKSLQNVILTANGSIPSFLCPSTLEIIGYCRLSVGGTDSFGFIMLNNYGSLQLYQSASIPNYPVSTAISLLQSANCSYLYNI